MGMAPAVPIHRTVMKINCHLGYECALEIMAQSHILF